MRGEVYCWVRGREFRGQFWGGGCGGGDCEEEWREGGGSQCGLCGVSGYGEGGRGGAECGDGVVYTGDEGDGGGGRAGPVVSSGSGVVMGEGRVLMVG